MMRDTNNNYIIFGKQLVAELVKTLKPDEVHSRESMLLLQLLVNGSSQSQMK